MLRILLVLLIVVGTLGPFLLGHPIMSVAVVVGILLSELLRRFGI